MSVRGWRGLVAVAAGVAACAGPPPPPAKAPPPPPEPVAPPPAEVPHELRLGPILLKLSDARTAQVFHLVDRLARSRSDASAEFAPWADTALPLDGPERAMLAVHAKLRSRRGSALDQAFYVDDAVDVAARAASDNKLLTAADAETERALLEHFAPRLDPLLGAQTDAVHEFELALAKEAAAAAPLAAQLGRFCETEGTVEVHAFLAPDPSKTSSSAELRAGRLVAWVNPEDDGLPTFFHTLFHAVLDRRRGSIAIAAQKCEDPVDPETLQEGLAYAFAPGLVHEAGQDVLLAMVTADQGRALSEPQVRAERLGLALRTELGSALEGGHDALGAFLPKVCEAWGKLVRP
jgi:hypothetical protein